MIGVADGDTVTVLTPDNKQLKIEAKAPSVIGSLRRLPSRAAFHLIHAKLNQAYEAAAAHHEAPRAG